MKNSYDIDAIVEHQHGIVRRGQLLAMGFTEKQLRWRIRPDGPWQVLLPGVYATFTGQVSRFQWWQAALLYAGEGAVLTGEPALSLWGIREQQNPRIPVLIPDDRRRSSRNHVSIFRTERMPTARLFSGLAAADPVRATADACRIARNIPQVRAVMTEALRSPLVKMSALAREIDSGQNRGSARLRKVVGEYSAGVRSVAEAQARDRVLQLPLPAPRFNVDLVSPDGEFIARPDIYWPEAALVVEVDSRRHHGDMEDWERTQRRHARMTASGLIVIHVSPARIASDWPGVAAEILAAYAIGVSRPPAAVRIAA